MDRIDGMIAGVLGEGVADHSTQVRLDMIEQGIKTFYEHPLTGIGIGNSSIITEELGLSTYLHNHITSLNT